MLNTMHPSPQCDAVLEGERYLGVGEDYQILFLAVLSLRGEVPSSCFPDPTIRNRFEQEHQMDHFLLSLMEHILTTHRPCIPSHNPKGIKH